MKGARTEMNSKNWDLAFRKAIDAADLSETYIPSHMLLAEIQTRRGFYGSAINTLTALQKEFPKHEEINFNLLSTYIESLQLVDAQKMIALLSSDKLSQRPRYASILSRYYLKTNNTILSIKWIQEAIGERESPLRNKSLQ